MLTASCGVNSAKREVSLKDATNLNLQSSASSARAPKPIPTPPWQLWSPDSLGDPQIEDAERALLRGDLERALYSYREASRRAVVPQVQQEAKLRELGTLLKLGQSDVALKTLSTYLKVQNRSAADADPRFSMIAAYAYLHAADWDQALAWFGMIYNKTNGQGVYARRAIAEAQRLVAKLPNATFTAYSQRWEEDPFAGRIFSREKLRRARGASADLSRPTNWFSPALYQPNMPIDSVPALAKVEDSALPLAATARVTPLANEPIILGVLLPLSGRYAEHAEKVKRGIEFAVSEMEEQNVRVVFADTQGDPEIAAAEYQRLVSQDQVTIVLGPLLVKTTENVSKQSQIYGVPIVSFTKREGVPTLGESVFRLGATVESQVEELLAYATTELQVRSVAILYPESDSGREFLTLFAREAARRNVKVLDQVSYLQGNEISATDAVKRVELTGAEAVFIPDTLENAFPVLTALDTSELNSAVLLGPAQWNDPIAVRGYGQLLDGAVYVAPFFPKSVKPNVQTFVGTYLEKFKLEPELLSAQAYDAAWFAVKALRSSTKKGEPLIQTLRHAGTLYGVTGRLDIDVSGEITRRMSVLRLHQGDVIEVMSSGVVSGFVPDGGAENRQQIQS